MRAALAAAAALLVLTGCVQVATPPTEGASLERRQAYADGVVDTIWSSSPLADLRPASLDAEYIDQELWGAVIVDCMADAGYTNYRALGSGVAWEGTAARDQDEELATLLCISRWRGLPAESQMLGEAQLEYLYDYYQQQLIPCLSMAGFRVTLIPTRTEFIEDGGSWIPQMTMEGENSDDFDIGISAWYRSSPSDDPLNPCATWPPEWKYPN